MRHEQSEALRTASAILCFGVAALSAAQAPDPAKDITARLRSGDTAVALTLSQRFLAQHPRDCRILSLQAVAYMQAGDTEHALHSFAQATKFCPDFLPALEGNAQIQFAKSPADAEPTLEHILALQPANGIAQGMLATSLYRRGDCKAALPHLQASSAAMPTQPFLRYAYGSCLAKTGDITNAIRELKTLTTEHPSDAATYDLAVLQWRNHEDETALATLEPLLAQGTFAPALQLGSLIAEAKGDTPRAVSLLRSAILLQPDNIGNYLQFAKLAFEHNSFQVGIDMVTAGLTRQPNSAQLHLMRGVLEAQVTKQKEAMADFEEAHRLDPKLSLSQDAIGIVQTQAHEGKVPLEFFREQAQREPNDPLLQYLLAEQASQEGSGDAEVQEAIAAAKRATAIDSHYQPAHDLLAKLYVRTGKPDAAIAEAELALAEDPDDQEALFQELMATRRVGAKDKIPALSKRLEEARKRNAQKLQENDRFRLVEAPSGQP